MEWFINHLHIFDFISHETPLIRSGDDPDDYDTSHPDFQGAWELSKQIARAWSGKLTLEFPESCFVTIATKFSGPILRFYKRRPVDMFNDVSAHFAESIQKDEAIIEFSKATNG